MRAAYNQEFEWTKPFSIWTPLRQHEAAETPTEVVRLWRDWLRPSIPSLGLRRMLTHLASTSVFWIATISITASLPPGYRYPTENDRTGDWDAFKAEVPTPFHASADFNGDGHPDEAWILLRKSGKGWGLFVFLGTTSGSQTILMLEEENGDTPAQSMGVGVVEPGEYETACGKGYWDCEPDEPEKLNLVLPALDFFAFESANSFFWWDARGEKFVRTWISD